MDLVIGNTPLVSVSEILDKFIINKYNQNNIFLKLENLNPSGSIKDRIAKYILEDAEKNELINKDTTILCSSSGNTGISVSFLCAQKNLKAIIFTNEKCSQEKKNIIKSYGAEVQVISDNYDTYEQVINKQIENSYCIDQYENPLNTEAHIKTLAPEIYKQCPNIDYVISSASTGGTITGIASYFKQIKKNCKVVCADPLGSMIFNIKKNIEGVDPYKSIIEGAGKDRITSIMNLDLIDYIYKIPDEKSIKICKYMANNGYLLGGSSGLNIQCAIEMINDLNLFNQNIVIICPDAGYRYMSKIY